MRRQIPTIQAPVQPAATAPTAATAVTVIMVHLMYRYLQASTEAAKAARLVQINLLTLHIQATAAQATAARGLYDAAYYLSGAKCEARNINCNEGDTKSQSCLTSGTQTATCLYGAPNAWSAWGSCYCNTGYCNNGSTCISIGVGYYRSGESCTGCNNKPANTYYTGAGTTTSNCSYSGSTGYCYNGSSYVTIPLGI